jgi:hypothetical protein
MTIPIRITSATADSAEFTVDASQFPLVVPAQSKVLFTITYASTFIGEKFTSLLHVQANEAGDHDTKLTVTASASVLSPNSEPSAALLESVDGRMIEPMIPNDWADPIRIEILNTLGRMIFTTNIMSAARFDAGNLPRGMYFYRITGGSFNQTGKLLLGQ